MIFGSGKKKHYKFKLLRTKQRVWDLEFLLSKLRLMREDQRREYDRMEEMVDAMTQYRDLIKAFGLEKAKELNKLGPEKGKEALNDAKNPPLSKEEQEMIDNLTKKIEGFNIDIEQLKKQMSGIDHQIEETFLRPGDGGILGTIDGYQTVIDLLAKEIKRL